MDDTTPPARSADAIETRSPLEPDPTIPARSGRHVPALDGVRGLAVLAVIVFHGANFLGWDSPLAARVFPFAASGWIGVDVFFVLSGFLITGILLDTLGGQRPFVNFYARRVLRIFPLYYAALAVVFIVIPLTGDHFTTDALRTIQHRQAWIWTHTTNIGFVVHRQAFADAGWLNLNHLWSLAVEEQFYLFWPLVVYVAGRRWLPAVCVGCIALSVALRVALWLANQRNGALYFPTPCRLDGLAMGGLLATLVRRPAGPRALIRPALVLAAVAAIALATLIVLRGGFRFTDSPTVAFGVLFVNVLATTLVLMLLDDGGRLARLFAFRPLRTVGKFSYGLYVVHAMLAPSIHRLIPQDGLLRLVGGNVLLANFMFISTLFAVSFAVALLTWHGLEKHFLKLKVRFHARPTSTGAG